MRSMLLLATQAMPQMRAHAHPNLGRLVTPRHYPTLLDTVRAGVPWAADNDGFQGVDYDAWSRMLDAIVDARITAHNGERRGELWTDPLLFVTVPDVVADAAATASRWVRWAPAVRRRGLPLAFVAQDGCELGLVPAAHEFDCLFIGGSTEWKLGAECAQLVRAAKRAGKWVHMGRVNTERRIRYAASIGCDSVDGTKWVRFRDTYLDRGLDAVATATAHPQLRLVA
jgi:hypothetical protein